MYSCCLKIVLRFRTSNQSVLFLIGHSRPLLSLYSSFWAVNMFNIKLCQWLHSYRRPVVLELTDLSQLSHNHCPSALFFIGTLKSAARVRSSRFLQILCESEYNYPPSSSSTISSAQGGTETIWITIYSAMNSVTSWWNKKLPNFPKNCPKSVNKWLNLVTLAMNMKGVGTGRPVAWSFSRVCTCIGFYLQLKAIKDSCSAVKKSWCHRGNTFWDNLIIRSKNC